MHVETTGRGTAAIVLVHGFGCGLEDWNAQREYLAPRHEVLACDLPGHGRTPGELGEASIAVFGARVSELLVRPSILVGHSMGCRVVLEAARRRPSQVRGLVLVDGSRVGAGDASASVESVRRQIGAVGYEKFIAAFFAGMIFRPLPQGEALIARAKRLPAGFGEALFLDIVRWDAAELDAALAAVRAPLMAIQSTAMSPERKRVTLRAGDSSPWLELLRSRVPGARVEVIPQVGHFTQIEAPGEVSRLIEAFSQTPR